MEPKKTILNFNMHQPLRLNPERDHFLWDEKNKLQFKEATETYYKPTLDLLADIMAKDPEFKFNLGMSGTFLEQAKEFSPELMNLLKDMISYDSEHKQVELLGETYYNSLAEFFKNPQEFNEQVASHRDLLKQEFDITPTAYRHTKRPFNNFVAKQLQDQDFKFILSDVFEGDNTHTAYRFDDGEDMLVLKRNIEMSHLLSRHKLIDASKYISKLEDNPTPLILSYALGRVGDESFRDFWKDFAQKSKGRLSMTLASESYSQKEIETLPKISIPIEHSISHVRDWKLAQEITKSLIDNKSEFELFKQIESLFEFPQRSMKQQYKRERSILTSYSNFRFLDDEKDDSPAIRSNPYGNSVDATFQFTRKVDDLEGRLKNEQVKFEILRRKQKDIILSASPELSAISNYIAHQGAVPINAFGGMALVASSMANYLAEQGFDSRILTLDMTQNYDKKAKDLYRQKIAADANVHEDKVYLVKSFAFDNVKNPYKDIPKEFLASESQNFAMKYVFPQLLKENRSIIHMYHDQIFGGVSSAKFKQIANHLDRNGESRLLKNVQYSHNIHSMRLSLDDFKDLPGDIRHDYLYYSQGMADSLLTGIKNSDGTIMVSDQWLKEVISRRFSDKVPEDFAREIEIQNNFGKVIPILNGLPRDRYPEFAEALKHPSLYFPDVDKATLDLVTSFGPESDILNDKTRNKLAFQRMVGLREDPDAILAVYSGRFDFQQKQCYILEQIVPHLQNHLKHKGIDLQFAYISDPVDDPAVLHSYNAVGAQAITSNGSITLNSFSLPLELLGNAGADVAVGTSYTEMCGLNDELALMHGALPAFTATGGIIDKITPYFSQGYKSLSDVKGNGVLFGLSHDDIWFGLNNAFEFASDLQKNPAINRELTYKRMVDARYDLSVEKQGAKLVDALGNVLGRPLK